MDNTDEASSHFEGMAAFCRALSALPAELCSHRYDPVVFGSWCAVVRCRGVRLRVVFDGKEGEFRVERSGSQVQPDEWQEAGWRKPATSGTATPIAELLQAVVECAG